MGRSQDSFNKKEREKKRQKRKKEKAEKKEQRKLDGKTTEEFMYVDINGNLTSTPPDPADKLEINIEDIEVSIPKSEKSDESNFIRSGHVKFFNSEKGYGFIIDGNTQDSFFVHIDGLVDRIKDNDKVTFEVGKGPKGPIATGVKLQK
jgi:cold shock CspA family protein